MGKGDVSLSAITPHEIVLQEASPVTRLGPFLLSRSGLREVQGEPTFDEWEHCGHWIQAISAASMWLLGDWLNYGERAYGEMYTQAMEATGLEYGTLRNAKYVAGAIELSRRRDNLTFAHHQEVAKLPPHQGDRFLREAEANGISAKAFRGYVRDALRADADGAAPARLNTCTVDDLSRLAHSGQKFGTIYADPPWCYSNQATRASTDNHYHTMTVDEIAALPVRHLAADQSHLWLWTTNAFLFECPKLFHAWDFEFKSSYVWVKPQMGIGNYLRNSHELLLLAVRGGLVGAAKDVMSWGRFDRTEHSAKPERIRASVVERLSPGPYLELFGRKLISGWAVWGNEVDRQPGLFDGEQEGAA